MAFDIFNLVNTRLKESQNEDLPDVPDEVRSFLGNLGMLNGIPLYYLIPDEKYLPMATAKLNNVVVEQGAFKFFWLDKEWIEAIQKKRKQITSSSVIKSS